MCVRTFPYKYANRKCVACDLNYLSTVDYQLDSTSASAFRGDWPNLIPSWPPCLFILYLLGRAFPRFRLWTRAQMLYVRLHKHFVFVFIIICWHKAKNKITSSAGIYRMRTGRTAERLKLCVSWLTWPINWKVRRW
jgi:hypothetical protein